MCMDVILCIVYAFVWIDHGKSHDNSRKLPGWRDHPQAETGDYSHKTLERFMELRQWSSIIIDRNGIVQFHLKILFFA